MVKANPFLIGRFLDPLFAVAVGVMSYYSFEKKVGRPEGHSLNELIAKRWKRMKESKASN
ncbi:LAFE_0G03334g1_1 [Lachancea fermentati]|uniref:LAFE_0G03334g1_1 n=1 Tax=Lachancea fermentati TaxID=4955 RepID=A0A1G4MGW8_LACFM|nr:LAFE_0G03334g1_1 [Lachancea fermentati]